MAASVTISYRVADVDAVARAQRTVVQSAQAAAKEAAKASTAAAKQAAKAQADAAKEAASAQKAAAKDASAFQRELNKADAAAFKARVKEQTDAARKAAKDQAAEAKRAGKESAAFQRELDRVAERAFKARVNEQVRAERDAARKADRAATKAAAAAEATAAGAQNRRRAAVGEIGSGAANGFKRGVSTLVGVGAMATGGLGMGTIANAIKSQMDLGERAALLTNSSGLDKSKFDSIAQAKKISSMTGTDAGEVMGGFEKIAAKAGGGGLEEAAGQMEALAKVAYGAGINMTDLGDAVGTLVTRGVKGKDLVTTIESLVQQGKDGAVEFNQLAKLLDASSGALGRFKMDDKERILSAGGFSQLARTYGKKSAEEATNAVEDLARDLGGKADVIQKLTGGAATTVHTKGKKTKKLVNGKMVETTEGDSTKTTFSGGVEVGTDSNRAQLRNMNDLLPEIIMGAIAKGNAGKIMGEGGIFSGNATAIVAPLIQAATGGIKKDKTGRFQIAGAGEKADLTGDAAIRAMLKQFSASDVVAGASDKAFKLRAETDTGKFKIAMETLSNELGTKLQPRIAELTPSIVKLASSFGEATIWIAENPKKAAAGFVALTTVLGGLEAAAGVAAKSIGSWALDKLFPKLVPTMNVAATNVNVVGGGAGGAAAAAGGAPGAAAAGRAGTAAKAGMGALALAAGAYEGWQIGVESGKATDAAEVGTRDLALRGQNLATGMRMNGGTEADRKRAMELKDQLESQSGARGAANRFLAGATRGIRGLADGDVTASNLVSAIPIVGAARGAVEAATGGGADKDAAASIEALKAVIDKPVTLAAGSGVRIENWGDMPKTGGGRDPATTPING